MLPSLVNELTRDTVTVSLPLAWPELVLAATVVAVLLVRVPPVLRRIDPFWVALAGASLAAGLTFAEAPNGLSGVERQELFTGMLVHDGVGVLSRGLLLGFAAVFVLLAKATGLASRDDGQDLYALLFGATLGMCLMCRANHLMTVFLAVEMASVPSYVLVGIVKGRRRAGEAALKYSVYGAAAAGVMLYGVSLLAGVTGTAHLPTLGERLAEIVTGGEAGGVAMTLAIAGVLVSVGLAFKLSAVPFHFWAPDVFAGAPAEVGAFLSVASKAAALVLVVRLVAALAPHDPLLAAEADGVAAAILPVATSTVEPSGGDGVRQFVATLVAVIAGVTCTFGNLAALGQTNAKRLLAYSTIAHAGYLLMPIAAAVALAADDPIAANTAAAAMGFYAIGYGLMNSAAFVCVAVLRNTRGTETIADYAGLIRTAPIAAVTLSIAVLGLLGLPPLVGFVGKLAALRSLATAGGPVMTTLLVVAVLNTALSLVYYLRVVKTVCLDEPAETALPRRPTPGGRWVLACLAVPIVLMGIAPEWLASATAQACAGLFG
ncbi:MAG: NADH-quinone oxidoreductase subunit N [Planctomycetota bacterium]